MDPSKEYFQDLSNLFRLGKYGRCIVKLEESTTDEWFESSKDLYNRINTNNKLICEYLEKNSIGQGDDGKFGIKIRSFYDLLKECIFTNSTSDADIALINNVLQFCCSSEISPESNISNYDCFCSVIIALKKVMYTFIGREFKPPVAIEIGDPCAEVITLFDDIVKSLQNCDKIHKIYLYSTLALILQVLFVMNGGHSNKSSLESQRIGWKTKVLQKISSKVPWFVHFIQTDEIEAGLSSENERTIVKSESHGKKVGIDFNVSDHENHDISNVLTSVPVFTCSVVGECVILQDYWQPCAARSEVKQYLLFTLCLIYQLCGDSCVDTEVLNVGEGNFSSDCINGAWKYFKGYLSLKTGKLKEALNEIDEADFSKFPVHFKSKKALLTASILLKMEKPMMALTILNKDALECEDCLPHALLCISEAYESLNYDESLLGVLRQLVKVLKHQSYMENLNNQQHSMLLKTLDVIHPLPEVNLKIALEKLAYKLCKYKLYEESAEYFLDLLALLEINGPAKVFRYHLHSAVVVILLLSENSEVDRTKEAISLCNKASMIFQTVSDHLDTTQCSLFDFEEDGPSVNKRPKLEHEVHYIFIELDTTRPNADQVNYSVEDGSLERYNSIEVKSFENEDIINEVHSTSIYASLMFSEHDLMSCILLSECASRENDFSRSLFLLNRCLQHISHHQVLERAKDTLRNNFLKTTDFILSCLWLKKAKVLIKKELVDGISFSKDVEHCFRNALLRNPDNAEIKYHYVTYLIRSGKREEMVMKEILSILEGKTEFDGLNTTSTLNLAIWYVFRCQVTEEQLEKLKEEVKKLK